MARRSSARLRNRDSSTPKRVSLSHDAPGRTPKTAPVKLSALHESDEMPGAFPDSASPLSRVSRSVANKQTTTIPVNFDDAIPKNETPIKPSEQEMHPKQHQQSTVKSREEARWLGFTNMAPQTEPPKQASKTAKLQGTPTKAPKAGTNVQSPKFRFTFGREQSLELSPEAKKLMDEKREEAVKIRQQMTANGEDTNHVEEAVGRKIATPKGKKGRFSDVHMKQFQKMDSIANHASSYRVDPAKITSTESPTQPRKDSQKPHQEISSPSKSLKRSPSKARLDEPEEPAPPIIARSSPKIKPAETSGHMPPSTSSKNFNSQSEAQSSSPAKRMKRTAGDDVSIARPSSKEGDPQQPLTPSPNKVLPTGLSYPDLSTVASPTQASLARSTSIQSINSSKIPAPTLARSPSKAAPQDTVRDSPKPSIPLLARSPSKVSLFARPHVEISKGDVSPLLKRSPLKASPVKNSVCPADKKKDESKAKEAPLLSRSPLKMSVAKNAESADADNKPSSSTPFLARSPAKIAITTDKVDSESTQTPGKSPGGSLMGRFNLLHSSPIKSILRSPQRLYSNDPAKVAAGTHLATPPKFGGSKNKTLPVVPEPTSPAEKHVDFTSSTKARYEHAQSEASSTPSKGPTPPLKLDSPAKASPKPTFAEYPSLPSNEGTPTVTPQKRRQTAAPGDFTFTAHGHGIVFGQSPNAPVSASRSPTIRHVSAEPQFPPPPAPATGSKKRKFDFENDTAADEETDLANTDKENAGETEDERPAKRVKPNDPEPPATKAATRLPTLGVKPKKTAKDGKDKKPTTISKSRLNALAQPKRRP